VHIYEISLIRQAIETLYNTVNKIGQKLKKKKEAKKSRVLELAVFEILRT
jgi:hypothetical protein